MPRQDTDMHAMRCADDPCRLMSRLPQLRLDERLQLMSRSQSGATSVLEQQFSRPSNRGGRENGTADTEIAPERDDRVWLTLPNLGELRPQWRTDGFSSLPFLRR